MLPVKATQGEPGSEPWPVKVSDGTTVATVRELGTSDALNVAISDSSGNQITSFGGTGTQYTEGDTDSTITGTAILWEDASNTLRAVSAALPLPVVRNIDTSRTELRFYASAATAGSSGAETALTLTKSSGITNTTSATSFVITSAKKFRITHMSFGMRNSAGSATVCANTFSLRLNAAGSVGTSSTPIIIKCRVATQAVASDWDRYTVDLGEGMEIPGDGTLEWGITTNATFSAAPTLDVLVIGYEY